MKRINLIFCFSIFLCSSPASMSQQRQPIRVGRYVQESKLIHRVEPVYPQSALEANVTGVVVMLVTVNEGGSVADVHVVRGAYLLRQSAVDAALQWRYAPTYLNGEAVSVMATVEVTYNIAARVTVNEFGFLALPGSGLEGDALIKKLKESRGVVVVSPSVQAPFSSVEERLRALNKQGIRFAVTGGSYVFHEGLLFHALSGLTTEPELALDEEHLVDIAFTSGKLPTAISLDSNVVATLAYQLFLSETGKVLFVQRLQGPEIPEIETELALTRVITPALIGADPVRAVATVEIPVTYERIKRK